MRVKSRSSEGGSAKGLPGGGGGGGAWRVNGGGRKVPIGCCCCCCCCGWDSIIGLGYAPGIDISIFTFPGIVALGKELLHMESGGLSGGGG